MARMHSRDKGKSRSTKPSSKTVPSWLMYKPKEIENARIIRNNNSHSIKKVMTLKLIVF